MTKKAKLFDILTKMKSLSGDQEQAHGEADDLLVEACLLQGGILADIAAAYEAARADIGFWYA